MVFGVHYKWVDLNHLIGHNVKEVVKSMTAAESELLEKHADEDELLWQKFAQRNNEESVQAARNRFLQQKARQQ